MDPETSVILFRAVHDADQSFEHSTDERTTHAWIRNHLLPALDAQGLEIRKKDDKRD